MPPSIRFSADVGKTRYRLPETPAPPDVRTMAREQVLVTTGVARMGMT
jgi:hypothetical protein